MMKRASQLGAIGLIVTLAACGGGGGSAPSAVSSNTSLAPATSAPNTSSNNGRASATATATIFIPSRTKSVATNRRHAAYVSPATESISINATRSDGWNDAFFSAVTPTTNGCTAVTTPSPGTQCVFAFSAPPTTGSQTDTIVVYCWDSPYIYQGNPVSSATAVVTVTMGASNPLSLVLGGILGSAPAWGAPSTMLTPGTAAQVSYPITGAMDIDGDAFAATDPLDSPLQITLSDNTTYTLVTPAPDSTMLNGLLGYASAVVLQYNGNYMPGHHTTLTMTSTSMDSDNLYGGGAPDPIATTLPF